MKLKNTKAPETKENFDIITVDDYEDLIDKFIHHLYHTDKTVALIAGRDLVEYVMDCVMECDETSFYKLDLSNDDPDIEYLISVTDEGYVTVIPLDDYEYLYDADIFYIDMDGTVSEDVIDECQAMDDKEVILFGLTDEDECDGDCDCCCQPNGKEFTLDVKGDESDIHGFTASRATDHGYVSHSFYSSEKLSDEQVKDFLKFLGY